MAPPPVEQNGGDSTTFGDATRSVPTPFLSKTYQLVDDHAINDVISWNEDGSAFVVWNPSEFARDLLPKYFKHNNFCSFVRQLNTYGFRKVVPDRWEFLNECFRRGEKHLLIDIQRRKIAVPVTTAATAVPAPPLLMVSPTYSGEGQVTWSTSSPVAGTNNGQTAELIGENQRLRKENRQLNKELSQMKNLCDNIYVLMSNYANNQSESNSQFVKPLDLLLGRRIHGQSAKTAGGAVETLAEAETAGASPKLFGVPIGVKRARGCEGEAADGYHELLQLQQRGIDVKSEPLGDQNGGGKEETPWLRYCYRRNQRVCNG